MFLIKTIKRNLPKDLFVLIKEIILGSKIKKNIIILFEIIIYNKKFYNNDIIILKRFTKIRH